MPTSAAPVAPPPRPSRRTYVLDRGFQLKYTLLLVVVGTVISLIFGGMTYLAHIDARGMIATDPSFEQAFAGADRTLLWLIAAITVVMATALGLVGILITHRVAGPVHVMSHYVSVLSRGRYPILRKLRDSDELKDFFERFRAAIESMRSREAGEADQIAEVIGRFSPLATGPEQRAALEALRVMHDRKREATDRIDVGRPA